MTVGAATSPIVLYYSLAQTLVALMAAMSPDFTPTRSHGLSHPIIQDGVAGPLLLSQISVKNKGKSGLFQAVAAQLHSETLSSGVTLSALVCSLIESHGLVGENPDPMPLNCSANHAYFDSTSQEGVPQLQLALSPLPKAVHERPGANTPPHQPIRDWLQPFPSLDGYDNLQPMVFDSDRETSYVLASWELSPAAAGAPLADGRFEEERKLVERVMQLPSPRLDGGFNLYGWVLPAVGGNQRALHPLATWLAVLFTMSMLARYHPALWTRMLDADESVDAERLKNVLDIARTSVPKLVHDEVARVDGHPSNATP